MCEYSIVNRRTLTHLFAALCAIITASASTFAEPAKDISRFNSEIQMVLNRYCADCHNERKQKGRVRLDNIVNLGDDQLAELLDQVEEQVFLEEMPPEDEVTLPTAERAAFLASLQDRNAALKIKSGFREKLKMPGHGNYVDHDELFSVDQNVHSTGGVENITNLPIRKLRFFREFFGLHKVLTLFKDEQLRRGQPRCRRSQAFRLYPEVERAEAARIHLADVAGQPADEG